MNPCGPYAMNIKMLGEILKTIKVDENNNSKFTQLVKTLIDT